MLSGRARARTFRRMTPTWISKFTKHLSKRARKRLGGSGLIKATDKHRCNCARPSGSQTVSNCMRRVFSSPRRLRADCASLQLSNLLAKATLDYVLRYCASALFCCGNNLRGAEAREEWMKMPFRSAKRNVNKLVARFNRVIKSSAREGRPIVEFFAFFRLLSATFQTATLHNRVDEAKKLVFWVIEWTSMSRDFHSINSRRSDRAGVKYPGYFNKTQSKREILDDFSFPIL